MPDQSYSRRLRSLLLCSHDVFRALNKLLACNPCWFYTRTLNCLLFRIVSKQKAMFGVLNNVPIFSTSPAWQPHLLSNTSDGQPPDNHPRVHTIIPLPWRHAGHDVGVQQCRVEGHPGKHVCWGVWHFLVSFALSSTFCALFRLNVRSERERIQFDFWKLILKLEVWTDKYYILAYSRHSNWRL